MGPVTHSYSMNDFDYALPEAQIAMHPPESREDSRLLIPHPSNHLESFSQIVNHFQAGDVLVRNISRVFPARIHATCKRTQRKHEILFIRPQERESWLCLIHNARRLKEGDLLQLPSGFDVVFEERLGHHNRLHVPPSLDLLGLLEKQGQPPLPPYIRRPPGGNDKERYQTVYASKNGSTAAPTAGLHFNNALFKDLQNQGVEILDVLLHVGPGTFLPVTVDLPEQHLMHEEFIEMSSDTALRLNQARFEKRRITAIGTTSLRTLESCYSLKDGFKPYQGMTGLYIYPPQQVHSADRLLTNFHQPRSSLLLLVSSFAGFGLIQEAYAYALSKQLRFLSYGDVMLLENTSTH
jgi:S-adenosylmethionine:tRNA ribosyltransferase-isomerase